MLEPSETLCVLGAIGVSPKRGSASRLDPEIGDDAIFRMSRGTHFSGKLPCVCEVVMHMKTLSWKNTEAIV